MAVAVVMELSGATLEQYDQALARMGFTPGGPGPEGSLSHWVVASDDGIKVTDLWETREQFDAFAAEKIGPVTQEVGVATPPQITYFEVHNHLLAG